MISLILLAFQRGKQLIPTLQSIRAHNYPDLEVVIAEDGDDGLTEDIAKKYGAKYVRHVRTEAWPAFQSIAVVRNLGVKASSGEILIMHDAETRHEGEVIAPLVEGVKAGDFLLAAKTQHNEGYWITGIVGARPQALRRSTFEAAGGFEESFFGYGQEDAWFVWLLNRRGVPTVQIDAMSYHQFHQPTGGAYEEYTGFANLSRAWALCYEIEMGERPPIANWGPLKQDSMVPIHGQGDMLELFYRRNAASAADDKETQYLLEMEWALGWAGKCEEEARRHPDRAERLLKSRDAHLALAGAARRKIQCLPSA